MSSFSIQPLAKPAIVAREAVRRLPRSALLLLCISYVLAGFVGREPWKRADIAAFGQMRDLALGASPWLGPYATGSAQEGAALLPVWLGALAIQMNHALGSWLSMDVAARLPFVFMLGLALAATWYGAYCLARLPNAQPVAFAFGGEAQPVGYARSLADGSLLALLSMLGLAQLSHETTPAVAQLSCAALLFFAVAASVRHTSLAAVAWAVGSLGLALSGAPLTGLVLAAAATVALYCHGGPRGVAWGMAAGAVGLCGAWLAYALGVQQPGWTLAFSVERGWMPLGKLWVWFTWPAWPLALLAVWRWRHWLRSLHMAWPLGAFGVLALVSLGQPAPDRSLLLALPALAVLAAMALPTLHRSISALIDWFAIVFFAVCSLFIWVIYLSLQTGFPAKPAQNVRRLLPGFEAEFSALPLVVALVATGLWCAVMVWRTGRHRSALWKSLVISASGAVSCWVVLTSLLMPVLDYSRGYAAMVARMQPHVMPGVCVYAWGLDQAQATALRVHGQYSVLPFVGGDSPPAGCEALIAEANFLRKTGSMVPAGWYVVHSIRRRSSTDAETLVIFKRSGG